MTMRLKRLNAQGLQEFEQWLTDGAKDKLPLHLARDASTSDPVPHDIELTQDKFDDRFALGTYLVRTLAPFDEAAISSDRLLWTTLALIWFDQICPNFSNGGRRLGQSYRYVLSADYRHYYRHLVRSPWQLVKDHGENSKFLLLPAGDIPFPLRRHGELLEQLGGRQSVLRSPSLISEASSLYSDPQSGRPRRGVAGSGGGSARRLGLVLRQLDLTFDVEAMGNGKLLDILPVEFDRFKIEGAQA